MSRPFFVQRRVPPLLFCLSLCSLVACGDFLGTEDSGPPEILSVFPEDGDTQVSVFATVRIRFSTELAVGSLAEGVSVRVGDRKLRARMYLKNAKTVLVEPTDPLDFGARIRVSVEPTVASRSGARLSEPHSWEFTTEGAPVPSPDPAALRSTVEVLAHDSMLGRGSGTPQEREAALYLQQRFESVGLVAPSLGWVQEFQATSRKTQETVSSQNVLGVLPGAGDLAGEWVVVGAHYDHIGVRQQTDGTLAINNGADDNASGTALVLEMATVLQSFISSGGIPLPDRRSVLFAAFGAEEEGLLGSCHYAWEAPVVPLAATRAMLNFDMVGRLREETVQVHGLGTAEEWGNLLTNANSPGLGLANPPTCTACSDFACFWDRGVPYVWFFTGTHSDYHTPADDPERLDYDGLAKVGELVLRVLTRTLVMRDGPTPLIH